MPKPSAPTFPSPRPAAGATSQPLDRTGPTRMAEPHMAMRSCISTMCMGKGDQKQFFRHISYIKKHKVARHSWYFPFFPHFLLKQINENLTTETVGCPWATCFLLQDEGPSASCPSGRTLTGCWCKSTTGRGDNCAKVWGALDWVESMISSDFLGKKTSRHVASGSIFGSSLPSWLSSLISGQYNNWVIHQNMDWLMRYDNPPIF